ncbi:MAG: thiol-disulfide oxidoreductase ResA [Nitrospirae bacterium CG_4_9_14_3_um_filter_51_5]|nr:MAG: thiol-disulfide oxidoreductase ResA [Nitrospirae bacterium CG_4_9_14_3_um_filter_51_5]
MEHGCPNTFPANPAGSPWQPQAVKWLLLLTCWVLGGAVALADTPSAPFTISRLDSGKSLPAFQLKTLQGESVDSKALSGRVLILNFWATWCGPCKEEMPSLERLRRQFSPEHLQILAVTTDIRPREIESFWKQLNLHFEVVLDDQEALSQALLVRNLPTTILVDTHGRIRGRVMGPREWDDQDAIAFVKSLILHP